VSGHVVGSSSWAPRGGDRRRSASGSTDAGQNVRDSLQRMLSVYENTPS
jgi:hypothetical protein